MKQKSESLERLTLDLSPTEVVEALVAYAAANGYPQLKKGSDLSVKMSKKDGGRGHAASISALCVTVGEARTSGSPTLGGSGPTPV